MRPHDLRNICDAVCLLALIRFRIQLCNTNRHVRHINVNTRLIGHRSLNGSLTVLYLLSCPIRMVQVDGNLPLTCAERVHGEHSRA